MTVVNYSVQETFGNNVFFFEGVGGSSRFSIRAISCVFAASAVVHRHHSVDRDPAGVAIALAMPKRGPLVSVCLVLMALPLLDSVERGGRHGTFSAAGYRPAGQNDQRHGHRLQLHPAATGRLVHHHLMDVWHWTSLVVLLAYAGLSSIPDAYYQAARIDGASSWSVFRYIQLPKMKRVLTIAVLLRFMDSFMIYTEPFVLTGGGPGNATTFLSIDLVKIALGQFDLGPAAAMSLIYFLIILVLSWIFLHLMMRNEEQ